MRHLKEVVKQDWKRRRDDLLDTQNRLNRLRVAVGEETLIVGEREREE